MDIIIAIIKEYKFYFLIIAAIIIAAIIIYIVAFQITKYFRAKSSMQDIIMMQNTILNSYVYEMPDKRMIQNMIHLPNDDQALLTNSMVLPEHVHCNDNEKRKETKMEVLNMFYNNSIDDEISIHARPQKLFMIP
jgi:uncharacterized membrane protein YvbJ